ncbi:hypothetical protein [uncultured Jatrophihabitans sp.]|uniref:hypothetical protein n=1 Tax=uncultured Jatrophihabitans sp. TaxID=1610747 RepID=UPI0035CAFDDA
MSNTRKAAIAGQPSITTTGKRKLTSKDKKPFTIDGDTYYLLRPKSIVLGQISNLIDPSRPWDEGENYRVIMTYTGTMVGYIEQTPADPDTGRPTGREWIQRRLSDPEDDLDLDAFVPLVTQILQSWMDDAPEVGDERPTGSPAASSPRPARSRSGASRAGTR